MIKRVGRIGWVAVAVACGLHAGSLTPLRGHSPVILDASFEASYAPNVLVEAKRELASIWQGSGFNFLWQKTGGERAVEAYAEHGYHVRLEFKGACDPSSPGIPSLQPAALGATHTTGGRVVPYSVINCERVRAILFAALEAAETTSARDRLFGRALARVISHELYHVLSRSADHLSSGIAKPNLSVEDLTEPGLRCDAYMLQVIHRRFGSAVALAD